MLFCFLIISNLDQISDLQNIFTWVAGIPFSGGIISTASSNIYLNEVLDKITSPIRLHRSKNFSKIFSKIFPSFSKTFWLFRDFENFSRNRSRRDDSFGPKIVEFRAILAIFRPFEDLDVRPDVQRCRNWRCNLLQHAIEHAGTILRPEVKVGYP